MAKDAKAYALITGASSGIGLEMAYLLAERGYSLILVARSQAALERIASTIKEAYPVEVIVSAGDLSLPQTPGRLYEQHGQRNVEVLINNAGFGELGAFAQKPLASVLDMIQLNVTSLTELTHRFLPAMIAAGQGRILNVASTAAFQPGPLMAVYYATKAFVLSFSEAIADELAEKGITVTALCPGPTVSGFQARAKLESTRMMQNKAMMMESKEVARQGIEALFAGKTLVITGLLNRLIATSVRFTPRRVVTKMIRRIQEPMTKNTTV